MKSKYVYWLNEFSKDDFHLVGKKAANLGEMIRVGLPVPDGFVICIEAFRDYLEESGAGQEISALLKKVNIRQADRKSQARFNREIDNIFKKYILQPRLQKEIEHFYKQLHERKKIADMRFSVRSSGILSRPGLYQTYLNVNGRSDIIRRVLDCWISALSAQAISVRQNECAANLIEPIAVVIQCMIPARSAGVVFTVDPATADNSIIVIESVLGLGEALVQDRIIPDKFIVERKSLRIMSKNIEQKTGSASVDAKDLKVNNQSKQDTPQPSLKDTEIVQLVKLALQVEAHFNGQAQDIEWAIESKNMSLGNIFLLQTRPIIKLSKPSKNIMKPNDISDIDHIVNLLVHFFYDNRF